jgi:hypothetical protein
MQRLVDDPQLCEHMSAVAVQRVAGFQARNVVSRIESIYEQLRSVTAGKP